MNSARGLDNHGEGAEVVSDAVNVIVAGSLKNDADAGACVCVRCEFDIRLVRDLVQARGAGAATADGPSQGDVVEQDCHVSTLFGIEAALFRASKG